MSDKLAWQCDEPECDRAREGNTSKCASHGAMARKASKMRQVQSEKQAAQKATQREKSREKRPRINSVSDKRQLQLITYNKLKEVWIKGKICACCKTAPAIDCHHQKGREGELLLLVEFWLPVCRPCHEMITKDSAFAISQGYSISRNQIPQ